MIIFLNILKYIGIVLLSIIGLVLALLLIVLFVPIRVNGKGYYKDKDYDGSISVSYLLHILSVKLDFKDISNPKIKIFGFQIKKSDKKDKKKDSSDELADSSEANNSETIEEDISEDSIKDELKKDDSVSPSDNDAKDSSSGKKKKVKRKRRKKNKKSKSKKPKTKKNLYDKINKTLDVIRSKEFQTLFTKCKRAIAKIIKDIFPKKWGLSGVLGFEDPSMNGKVCALLGILYPVFDRLDVYCDFENPGIDIKGYFKGKIFIFIIVFEALRIYFNKNLKKIISMFKAIWVNDKEQKEALVNTENADKEMKTDG